MSQDSALVDKREIDCPHCKGKIDVEIHNAKPKVILDEKQTITQKTTQPEQQKTKEIEVLPEWMPAFRCKDGNCDIGVHKNKNYRVKPKGKCTNCNQFSRHKEGDCPWCKDDEGKRGQIEELEDDELENLHIPNPPEVEHEHE